MLSSSKQSIVHSLIRWPLSFFFVDVHILVLLKILHCHMQIDLQTVCKHFFKINIWMLELLSYSFVNQINIQLIKCSCCISCYIDLYKVLCTLGKTKINVARISSVAEWVVFLVLAILEQESELKVIFLLNSVLLTEKLNQFYSVSVSNKIVKFDVS